MTTSKTLQNQTQAVFRLFQAEDYDKGVFDLLSQLTKAPQPTKLQFMKHLDETSSLNSKIINIVGELNNEIIAFGTIIICNTLQGKNGKIQNIVTCKKVRGKGYGKIIVQKLKLFGWRHGCNKVSLFCQDKNIGFYQKLGFQVKGQMQARYN